MTLLEIQPSTNPEATANSEEAASMYSSWHHHPQRIHNEIARAREVGCSDSHRGASHYPGNSVPATRSARVATPLQAGAWPVAPGP